MVDKTVIQQVLGGLLKKPTLLSEVDKYNLTLKDFSTKFERYIFYAINGLYYGGAKSISILDIENYLSSDPVAKKTFEDNNGIEYLQDIEAFTQEDNFQYYYDKLKKINLLNDLKKSGFDTSEFYAEDLAAPDAFEINQHFEEISAKDIVDKIKRNLLQLESTYASPEEVEKGKVSDGLDDFIDSLSEVNEIGMPIQGNIFNQVIDGAQLGALTIRSAASSVGKTRTAVADACFLAYPIRFNSCSWEWEQKGSSEKVLFIVTEQTFRQVKKMILAYLTDFNESCFKYGNLNDEQMKVVEQAKQVIEKYKDNFILLKIPNPTIELVKTLVREQCLTQNIRYVFYDYIFIGPALLNEFRGFNLRNDEVLLMFATALKDLAVELNVCIFTSTQVNANADNNQNIRNESSLAGGRSTINKADNGAIMARPTKDELETLEPYIREAGVEPNLVTDVFKVRSGQWTQVRIWSYMDLGTMKKSDLFITDSRLFSIDSFFDRPEYHLVNWEDEEEQEINNFVKELNGL